MPDAVIFDYGVGNLLSLKCALEKVGLDAKIGVTAQQLKKADAIALPGVGNFSAAATKLDAVKVPHMGWNTLRIVKPNEFFEGVADGSYVYFVHSLYPVPTDKGIVAAETEYGATFTSAIASKNVFGTQFHPEKSGDIGLKILDNFAKIVRR